MNTIRTAHEEVARLQAINAELLAALVEMMGEFEPGTMYQGREEPAALILARAAIAKARGTA